MPKVPVQKKSTTPAQKTIISPKKVVKKPVKIVEESTEESEYEGSESITVDIGSDSDTLSEESYVPYHLMETVKDPLMPNYDGSKDYLVEGAKERQNKSTTPSPKKTVKIVEEGAKDQHDGWFYNDDEQKIFEKPKVSPCIDLRKFNDAFNTCTHLSIRDAILLIDDYNKFNIITADNKSDRKSTNTVIYVFDKKTTLWKRVIPKVVRNILTTEIRIVLKSLILFINTDISLLNCKANTLSKKQTEAKLEKLTEKSKKLTKCLTKVEDVTFMDKVTDAFCVNEKIYNSNFQDELDAHYDIVNFKNYIVNLRTGKYRKRTSLDYYTKTLDFDFDIKYDKEICKHIEKIFLQVCNDDPEMAKLYRYWFGYCMTGEVTEELALWIVGHSAQNGKSSLIQAFSKMFSIYVRQFGPETYNKNYQKKHKEFADIDGIRAAFLEEQDKEKIDMQVYKAHTGGAKMRNEVMFDTTRDIIIRFKLMFLSNSYPNMTADNGANRRTLVAQHTNLFLRPNAYKTRKNEKGVYVVDSKIASDNGYFSRDDYKLALFHYLMPAATEYYQTGFSKVEHTIDKYLTEWKEIADEKDNMKQFVSTYYETTDNDDDRIHKDVFLKKYRDHSNLTNISWANILNDVKRVGLEYDRQKLAVVRTDFVTKKEIKEKGAIMRLKKKSDAPEQTKKNNLNYDPDNMSELIADATFDDTTVDESHTSI